MDNNRYKEILNTYTVPRSLINKTAATMEKALLQHSNKGFYKNLLFCGSAAAVFLAVIIYGVNAFYFRQDNIFRTHLAMGEVCQEVILADGYLLFDDEEVDLSVSIPVQLSIPANTKTLKWTKETYEDYLGQKIPVPVVPKGMELNTESVRVFETDGGEVVYDEFKSEYINAENAQRLTVVMSKGRMPLQSNPEQSNYSRIKDVQLAVGDKNEGTIFYAQYLNNGIGYFIETEQLSQKAFIEIIYRMIQGGEN